jgi:hypothetical protein
MLYGVKPFTTNVKRPSRTISPPTTTYAATSLVITRRNIVSPNSARLPTIRMAECTNASATG